MSGATGNDRDEGPVRIGIVADTHGRCDPALLRHFTGVECIFHAGDIGDSEVLRQLERMAPVHAVSGNVDGFAQSGVPAERVLELAGLRFALRHILYEGGALTASAQAFLSRVQPDVCIFGHTHRPLAEWHGSTLLFNPGCAGPRRFQLPRACGVITVCNRELTWQHCLLE